ncbi:MAG TPA: amino acid permease, partial [Paenibacillaceae bacterium]|nr:amino acid permease [Paenibacillaceae bacterium]
TGKQKLKATIGLPQAIALNIGAVLGSGILLMPGVSAQLSGPASLIAWGIMALFVLPMALSMGLLSSAYSNSGGVSHFATLAFGRKIGALVGWFFLMSVTIGGPIVAIIG